MDLLHQVDAHVTRSAEREVPAHHRAGAPKRVQRAAKPQPQRVQVAPSTSAGLAHQAGRTAVDQHSKLNRRNFGLAFTTACPVCASMANGGAALADGGRYNYEKDGLNWRDTTPDCGIGMEQSPINVPLRKLVRDGSYQQGGDPVNMGGNGVTRRSAMSSRRKVAECNYATDAEGVNVENNGFTFQVNVPPGSTAKLNGEEHNLVQYHFHTPSEHAFDNQYTAMEVHLVHQNKEKGNFAVLGVLLEGHEGAAPLAALDIALRGASASAGSKTTIPTPVNLQAALAVLAPEGDSGTIVNFPGSLTTPPCSEGVEWFLSTEIVGMPPAQINSFSTYRDTTGRVVRLGNNARPVQPIGDRKLVLL